MVLPFSSSLILFLLIFFFCFFFSFFLFCRVDVYSEYVLESLHYSCKNRSNIFPQRNFGGSAGTE